MNMSEERKLSPVVQIVCVTYNQENYIGQALDGFLMQETTFPFEILVGDDCSTDRTSEIVADYARRFPGKIRHFRREPNMGCLANFMDLCERITAPYAAFCDGDDFWTDSHKLQRQYAIMERNPEVNVCAHLTQIQASPEWTLYSYYKKQNFLIPAKPRKGIKIGVAELLKEWPHTSSFFMRWNLKEIPEWAKVGGVGGDIPILFLPLGKGLAYIIDDVMSVYRRGAGGVVDGVGSLSDHFLNTRIEHMKLLACIRNHYRKHYDSYGVDAFTSRLWTEVKNFLDCALTNDRWDLFEDLRNQNFEAYEMAKSLLEEYRFRIKAINILGVAGANVLFYDTSYLKSLKRSTSAMSKKSKSGGTGKPYARIKKIVGFFVYWTGALVPKRKCRWAFSGFAKKTYLDNTKYFFEFVNKEHPEIEAIWFSMDDRVVDGLRNRGYRAYSMRSVRGIWAMLRSSVAITDHFRSSDYNNCLGFNACSKVVNLWHGAGLKNMVPIGDKIPNTDVPGVRLSSDILPAVNDSLARKLSKHVKYFFRAPFREMFERYFLIVCANEPFVQNWAKRMHCPDKAILRCGYPRNEIFFRKMEPSTDVRRKIIYAPTYRMKADFESEMLHSFLVAAPAIGKMLEEKNASFVLRLHPHTWRNYSKQINDVIRDIPRISVSKNRDAYQELADYDIMIGDYSSIVQDYMISGRPVVLLAIDKERFLADDCGFCMPYEESMPGPVVDSWEKAIEETARLLDDPTLYADVRERVSKIFGMENFECEHASEKIVTEIKKRLSL